jgi:hypothetical protein
LYRFGQGEDVIFPVIATGAGPWNQSHDDRHAVSRVRPGQRPPVGIIFQDAT